MTASLRTVALAACALLVLSACAGSALLPDDPLASDHPLWMVPINRTDRWAINMAVEKFGMGDGRPHNDGSAAACCYPGPKDWGQSVTARWTWGTEVDPKTKAVLTPREPHSMVTHFPPGGPAKDEDYLCLILRDNDTAELAFARSRTHCATK